MVLYIGSVIARAKINGVAVICCFNRAVKSSYDAPLLAFVIDPVAPSAKAGDATLIVTSATANSAVTTREAVFKNDFMLRLL